MWDNESTVGQWWASRPRLTEAMNAFRGTLGIKVVQCRQADPEANGLVERATAIWRPRSCPAAATPTGKSITTIADDTARSAIKPRWTTLRLAPTDEGLSHRVISSRGSSTYGRTTACDSRCRLLRNRAIHTSIELRGLADTTNLSHLLETAGADAPHRHSSSHIDDLTMENRTGSSPDDTSDCDRHTGSKIHEPAGRGQLGIHTTATLPTRLAPVSMRASLLML